MILAVIAVIIFFFLNPTQVLASSIQINEFLAHPSTGNNEWVEFYNPSEENMSSYYLDDDTSFTDDSGSSSKKSLSSINTTNPKYPYLEFSSFLNNDGDRVVLFSSDGTIIDQYQYTSDPSTDKSIGRNPDGSNWTNLATSSKGNSNGGSTSTPTPTPTPTTSPTSSPSTSSFTISNTPSQINSDQSFSVLVNLSFPNNPSTNFYLKGAFKTIDGSNYFGLTKVSGAWIKNGSSYSNQYQITTDSSGNWSGNLEVQPDSGDSGFTGTGDYIFKVARYTSSGSGPTWNADQTMKINSVAVSNQEETSTDTAPSTTPTLTSSTKTSSKLTYQIASVAGAQTTATESATPSATEVKSQKQINFSLIIGIMLIVSGIGLTSYIYLQSHETIFNKFRKRN